MTPKEKSYELLWKYLPILEGWKNIDNTLAKKCAIITIDEILSTKPHDFVYNGVYVEWLNKQDYWNEVKQEIEKL